jgi:hypothetical protein
MWQNIPPIEEITCHSFADLTEQILCSTKPLVLRGLVKSWPLVQQAVQSDIQGATYLNQFYQQKPVSAMVAPAEIKGRFFYNEQLNGFNFSRQQLSLDGLLGILTQPKGQQKDDAYYVGSTSIDQILPGLRSENDIPQLTDKPLVSIWIGNHSRIAAHYDVTDNVACVAAGRRRFTLFPPEQLENLYIGPLDFTLAGQAASLVDFHHIDHQRFPKFKQALEAAQVAELEPGDGIFIPSMWWHHIEALSQFNVLINYWWRQVDRHLGAPQDALNHALLSIKDLPLEQRQAWRRLFDHYVFSPQEQQHIPEEAKGVLKPIDKIQARKLRATLLNNLNR